MLAKWEYKTLMLLFFTLGFHSINLFSSSKDQVLRPISLVLSCKCRELLTLLYIIGKLSNYMLYNYMFSSLEMDPGDSFQPGKKHKTKQSKPNQKNPWILSNDFFFFAFYAWMTVLYLLFSAFLYCIQILGSKPLKERPWETKRFSADPEKYMFFSLSFLPLQPLTDYFCVANLLHFFACFRIIY